MKISQECLPHLHTYQENAGFLVVADDRKDTFVRKRAIAKIQIQVTQTETGIGKIKHLYHRYFVNFQEFQDLFNTFELPFIGLNFPDF